MNRFPSKFISAVIALNPLPSTPLYDGKSSAIVEKALNDLEIYQSNGVDSVLFANDYDRPFLYSRLAKEDYSIFEKILKESRKSFLGPIGLNVKLESWKDEIALAKECNLDFIRVGNFSFPYLGSSGIVPACAAELVRERKRLGAENVMIFADIKKKHVSHSITSDISFETRVKECESCLADAVVVTSHESGVKPNYDDVIEAGKITKLPVIVGSGADIDNIKELLPIADSFIIGSNFRNNGGFYEEVDPQRVKRFMTKVKELRESL